MPPRGSTAANDGGDGDNDDRRRQPFRPLQPFATPPSSVCKSTPPREVILTPRATPKPIKRKATARLKRLATKIKSEPPEVDLSKIRPPSPSDDPLLLSGRASTRSPPLRARFTPAFSSSPLHLACADPPVSFAARLSGARVGSVTEGSSPNAGNHALPIFSAPRTVEEPSDAWSDSDDDGFNLTGEYTGKFKILKVPTKADPSTSERISPWGRPVSPFPYSAIMERSLPLSEVDEGGGTREGPPDSTMACEELGSDVWETATEPPLSDVEHSPLPSVTVDEFADLDDDFSIFDLDAESTRVFPRVEPRESNGGPDQLEKEEEEEEEAQIDRELSVVIDDAADTDSKPVRPFGTMEDSSSEEEDDMEGEDIIKITSEDPKAAARAAAILRMHDYDCILAAEKKQRSNRFGRSTRKRRKTIENAGISKSYVDPRTQGWKKLQATETSPGSRSLPLLELWRDAEQSVFLEHHSTSYRDTSFTLSPLKTMTTRPPPLLPPPGGEWTRDCWKSLDRCLVAERLAVAAAHGLDTDVLADLANTSKDAVLDRFAGQVGGESVLAGLGPDWSRDNLILRLDVLVKKQSRRTTRAPVSVVQDASEPHYQRLLQEAKALSGTLERCPTSSSVESDATAVVGQYDMRKMLPDLSSYLEPAWQTTDFARVPIRTPSRTPDPRLPHPKDQVHLRQTSLPHKSMIPVPVRPKRLVDLRHLSPVKDDRGRWRPAARRSSGCSVKDLVKQYESLDK